MGEGVFFVKSGKWGCFVKKWTFPRRRVHYVQYQYFLFCILFIWGCVRTQRTPLAYRPARLAYCCCCVCCSHYSTAMTRGDFVLMRSQFDSRLFEVTLSSCHWPQAQSLWVKVAHTRLELNSTTRTRTRARHRHGHGHGLFCGETPLGPCGSVSPQKKSVSV